MFRDREYFRNTETNKIVKWITSPYENAQLTEDVDITKEIINNDYRWGDINDLIHLGGLIYKDKLFSSGFEHDEVMLDSILLNEYVSDPKELNTWLTPMFFQLNFEKIYLEDGKDVVFTGVTLKENKTSYPNEFLEESFMMLLLNLDEFKKNTLDNVFRSYKTPQHLKNLSDTTKRFILKGKV